MDVAPQMVRLRHIAIATKDPEKTASFYQKVFGLKFIKRVSSSPRVRSGVFLTDGHTNFAFLDYHSDEAADMKGGATFEGLHHLGFHVDNLDEINARISSSDAEKIGSAEGTDYAFDFDEKYRGPNGVIIDVSTKDWEVSTPDASEAPASKRKES